MPAAADGPPTFGRSGRLPGKHVRLPTPPGEGFLAVLRTVKPPEDECRRSRGWTVRAKRVPKEMTAGIREDPAVSGAPDDAAVELVGRVLLSGGKDIPGVPLARTSALRPTVKVMGEMRFEAPADSFDPDRVGA